MKIWIYLFFLFSILLIACHPSKYSSKEIGSGINDFHIPGFNEDNLFNPLYGIYTDDTGNILIQMLFYQIGIITSDKFQLGNKHWRYYNYSRYGDVFTFCSQIGVVDSIKTQKENENFLSNFCSENTPVAQYRVIANTNSQRIRWKRIKGVDIFMVGKDVFNLNRDIAQTIGTSVYTPIGDDQYYIISYLDLKTDIALVSIPNVFHSIGSANVLKFGNINGNENRITIRNSTIDVDLYRYQITLCTSGSINCNTSLTVSYRNIFKKDGSFRMDYVAGKKIWGVDTYNFVRPIYLNLSENKQMEAYILDYLYAGKAYLGKSDNNTKIKFTGRTDTNTFWPVTWKKKTNYAYLISGTTGIIKLAFCGPNQKICDTPDESYNIAFSPDSDYLALNSKISNDPFLYMRKY